jgi:hypothetical protein
MAEKTTIDWEALGRKLGTVHEDGEGGSSEKAREALGEILGAEALRDAVEWYLAFRPGYELVRHVLWLLRPAAAIEHCRTISQTDANDTRRCTAVELLRGIADARALSWIDGYLDDPHEGIQTWGAGILDQLTWDERVDEDDPEVVRLRARLAEHDNPQVRERGEWIESVLLRRARRRTKEAQTSDDEA